MKVKKDIAGYCIFSYNIFHFNFPEVKKITMAAILLAAYFAGNAQIDEKESADWQTIGRLKFGGITKAKMEFTASGVDTTYMLFIKHTLLRVSYFATLSL